MATSGGQPGNTNAAKGREWFDALRKQCVQRGTLAKAAEALCVAAEAGEQWAIVEIGNRMDGKPAQAVQLSGPDGGPIQTAAQPIPTISREDWIKAYVDSPAGAATGGT